ncbi:MAG TPA: aminoglycoside phosphotransferase family protein [Solirubrobacteraceae bacterium]
MGSSRLGAGRSRLPVEREARVLALLRATAVPAPEVLSADPAGVACGVPALLMTRLAGQPPHPAASDLEDFCRQLAQTLATIHDHGDLAEGRLEPYRLYYDREHFSPAAWLLPAKVWIEATAAVRVAPPASWMTLIHRDYHPENTLWSDGVLTERGGLDPGLVGPGGT